MKITHDGDCTLNCLTQGAENFPVFDLRNSDISHHLRDVSVHRISHAVLLQTLKRSVDPPMTYLLRAGKDRHSPIQPVHVMRDTKALVVNETPPNVLLSALLRHTERRLAALPLSSSIL